MILIVHMLVSNTNKYENLYAKVKFNLIDTQTKYNVTIDKGILETIRNGNNTIFLRHSDDDTKDRNSYFDTLSIISDFDSMNLSKTTKLSQKGKIESEILSLFFKKNNISFEEVWSSPIVRSLETASYFSKNVNSPDFLYLDGSLNDASNLIEFSKLFYNVKKSKNILIIGHQGYPDIIGIPTNLNKSDFIVYNNIYKRVILHGSLKSITNYYTTIALYKNEITS